jgi:hypothetical protein
MVDKPETGNRVLETVKDGQRISVDGSKGLIIF